MYFDDSHAPTRRAYMNSMIEIAVLFGADRETAVADMTDVLELDTQLANVGVTFLLFYKCR